ncbi:MAG: hypothetical protein AAFX79_12165 [Planctomycetota bacterium]
MITRFRQYVRNLGPIGAIVNSLVLGYLVYAVVRSALDAGGPFATGIILGVAGVPLLLGLLGPRLVLGFLIEHASFASKLIRGLQFAVIGFVVVLLVLRPPLPWWGFLIGLGAVSLLHGLVFWFFSDPRLLTGRGLDALERMAYGPETT